MLAQQALFAPQTSIRAHFKTAVLGAGISTATRSWSLTMRSAVSSPSPCRAAVRPPVAQVILVAYTRELFRVAVAVTVGRDRPLVIPYASESLVEEDVYGGKPQPGAKPLR